MTRSVCIPHREEELERKKGFDMDQGFFHFSAVSLNYSIRRLFSVKQEDTMEKAIQLKQKLLHLKEQITETKKRLPAHSIKPPVMMDLLALEDEYDSLFAELNALEKDTKDLA
jgi:hypothetical protein